MALSKITTASLADDSVSTDQIANNAVINTSGAITTTGAFTSKGIDDNATNEMLNLEENANSTTSKMLMVGGNTHLNNWSYNGRAGVVIEGTGNAILALNRSTTAAQSAYIYHDGALGITNQEANNINIGYNTGTAIAITSDRHVTKPYHPVFHAVSTGSGFGHDSIMVFNTALLNTGSHYNTSNGKFTAPVAGVYFFYHHNIGTSTSTVIRVKVYYNDSVFDTYKQIATRQDTSQGNDYAEGHITFAVSLSANDTIKLGAFADDSSSGIYNDNSGGQGFNYFGGYLIG